MMLLLLGLALVEALSAPIPRFEERAALKEDVRNMFHHAYDNYMKYAFPHDELKPLSLSYTDSLEELGNLKLERLSETYSGSALTLVESLSSLAVMKNSSEFEKGVLWLAENLSFDVDVRVNVFECNIRLLGGLISAHFLAKDSRKQLMSNGYNDQLLMLAEDLGLRLLPAFDTPTGIPYAWINLKTGVHPNETTETSTSGCGSLVLEMGALSRLTGNPQFENLALRALRKLWSMRSELNLLGTNLDINTGRWTEYSSGIGAGIDSFYEYLVKAYILFGGEEYWDMFQDAYRAVQQHYRYGSWYHDADMRTGKATYWQFTSLQAFWPGLQVLIGDIAAANATHREFLRLWEMFGIFPERYLLDAGKVHPTERYYPLRPELAESTFFLYQATKDPWYLDVGKKIMNSINVFSRVPGGFASVRDVMTMKLEDHQHSFFLSETCKYLYLLFDDSFLDGENHVFSTEGHLFPVNQSWQQQPRPKILSRLRLFSRQKPIDTSALTSKTCPRLSRGSVESACHIPDTRADHRCVSRSDCGVDATTCAKRSCSFAGYCS
ncbi:alpha-mannosidase I MNS5 isoform X1 [Selaginella moellendorffii]|uniref:alpha-mannosidase I MNS5 isoform X1 n=2 Tax=Selaginella moellendorffii TaxID=88036 RepID=UPI000D1C51EA|nr:alpha-mannosidase I MNS5 isoform X1 [Selaginella moellendorffii]|eukprot:XP_024523829.1 alpha-mannosidase I MNS5 isoform X1 [Selaginella moellendorffii]